jgi:2'-5' RNA ligase
MRRSSRGRDARSSQRRRSPTVTVSAERQWGTSDQVTSAREARATPLYQSRTELTDHWQWRPEWTVDRPCLLWYLTFENQPRLWQMAERLHGRLDGVRTVDPVPSPWLHLTVEDVAFVDEVAPRRIDDLVEAAASAIVGWAAPPLILGPVALFGTALVFEARPRRDLSELRDRLRACTTLAVGPDKVRGPRHFRPHVSFAYVNGRCEPRQVLERIEGLGAERVVVSVPRLTLAAVTRRNRHYQWIARATLDLQAGAPVADPVGRGIG